MDIRFLFIAQKGNDKAQLAFTKEITALYCHHKKLALCKHLNRQGAKRKLPVQVSTAEIVWRSH